MPLIQKFSENGKLVGEKDEPLDQENLEQFISKFGKERAVGYMQAVNDICMEMEELLYIFSNSNVFDRTKGHEVYVPVRPHRATTRLRKFFKHKVEFLKYGKTLIDIESLKSPKLVRDIPPMEL